MGFEKLLPKNIIYQDYEEFDNEKFWADICISDFDTSGLEGFKNTNFCIFNKNEPIKRKHFRANEDPFAAKDIHKSIKKRSKPFLTEKFTYYHTIFVKYYKEIPTIHILII